MGTVYIRDCLFDGYAAIRSFVGRAVDCMMWCRRIRQCIRCNAAPINDLGVLIPRVIFVVGWTVVRATSFLSARLVPVNDMRTFREQLCSRGFGSE